MLSIQEQESFRRSSQPTRPAVPTEQRVPFSSNLISNWNEMESIFRNIDSLEESHVNISKLIDQLEIESRQDNGEVHQLITGMDSMLNQVGDNHFELQREIEELLESSRRGALSHEKLADMIHAEQVRSNYLTNIVSSLKSQIEGLFTKLVVVTEDEDSVSNPGEIVEQVSDNVNLLWKSVDSLSKLISSPTKKLEYNIQKIDSEVIVHLNKTLHLHDRQSAPTLESFPEKMETQVKAVKKKIEKKNSVPNAPNMDSHKGGYDKHHPQHHPPANQQPKAHQYPHHHHPQQENHPQSQHPQHPHALHPKNDHKILPPEQSSISVEEHRRETFIPAPDPISATKKKNNNPGEKIFLNAPEPLPEIKPNNADANPPLSNNLSSNASLSSLKNDITMDNLPTEKSLLSVDSSIAMNGDESPMPEVKSGSRRPSLDKKIKSDDGKSKRRKSKGSEGHHPKADSNSDVGNKSAPQEAPSKPSSRRPTFDSTMVPAKVNAPARDKRAMTQVPVKKGLQMDDEASVGSATSLKAITDSYPVERSELVRLLKEKEKIIADKEKNFDDEIKKGVKEYLRTHGIGFGAQAIAAALGGPPAPAVNSAPAQHIDVTIPNAQANKNVGPAESGGPSLMNAFSDSITNLSADNLPMDGPNGQSKSIVSEFSPKDKKSNTGDGPNDQNPDGDHLVHPTIEAQSLMSPLDPSSKNISFQQGNDENEEMLSPNSKNMSSRFTSRGNSREGNRSKNGTILLQNPLKGVSNRDLLRANTPDSNPPSGAMTRQSSMKLTRAASLRDEINNGVRSRFRASNNMNNNNPDDLTNIPENQQEQEKLEGMIDTIFSNISKNGVEPKDWNLIRIATPAVNNKVKKEEKMTSTEDLEEVANKKLYELPVFDNQNDILVTRSYKKETEGISFHEQLLQSPNPLYVLFQEFAPFLSQLQKDRLFYASLLSTSIPLHPFSKQSRPVSPSRSSNQTITPTATTTTSIPGHLASSFDSLLVQRNRNHVLAAANQILLTSKKVFEEGQSTIPMINAIETVINDSVQIVKAIRKAEDIPSHNYLVNSLTDCYKIIGALEGKELTTNLRVMELRAFFESIQAISKSELAILFQESAPLKEAYNNFVETQGTMLEVHRRLIASKERARRYQLKEYLVNYPGSSFGQPAAPISPSHPHSPYQQHQQQLQQQQTPLQLQGTQSNSFLPPIIINPSMLQSFQNGQQQQSTYSQPGSAYPSQQDGGPSNYSFQPSHQHRSSQVPMTNEQLLIRDLQADLKAAEEEIEDLEMEMIQMMKEKDPVPPAILFFSMMADPSFIPNLQQLILQFKSIKQFLDYSVNMDYLTLRKRLQVCLVLMPSIDKLIEKYSSLYGKWSHYRLNWFAERKVRGSASDGMNCCPLCYHDMAEDTEDGTDNKNTKKNSSKKEELVIHNRVNGRATVSGGNTPAGPNNVPAPTSTRQKVTKQIQLKLKEKYMGQSMELQQLQQQEQKLMSQSTPFLGLPHP